MVVIRYIFLLLSGTLLFLHQPDKSYEGGDDDILNDGPYIFMEPEGLKARWIEQGRVFEEMIEAGKFESFRQKFRLKFDYDYLASAAEGKPAVRYSFRRIDSIIVLSDLHGEFDTYSRLLTVTGVTDENLNWKFGKGHLVVIGDVFDRGDHVTEIFWHLFGLEKQAADAGGMVHFLIGNHEMMLMSSDKRYIHEKYRQVEKLAGGCYAALYAPNSVLGQWIRSKPVVITINNMIFVHGGLSIDMVRLDMSISRINYLFSSKIIGRRAEELLAEDPILYILNGSKGPVWYRGYFEENGFSRTKLDSVLTYYAKRHIIVGHTVSAEITPLFNNRIIAVDAGISSGLSGSVLLIKEGIFYRGTCDGQRLKL